MSIITKQCPTSPALCVSINTVSALTLCQHQLTSSSSYLEDVREFPEGYSARVGTQEPVNAVHEMIGHVGLREVAMIGRNCRGKTQVF